MVICLLLPSSPGTAETFSDWLSAETHRHIVNYTETLTSEKNFRSNFEIGNLDPRLNFQPCEKPLSFAFNSEPLSQSQNTLKVECNDPKRWTVFVGVKINIFKNVWVASQTLPRNHHLTPLDLELAEIQVNQSRLGYFINKNNLLNMKLRRSIQAGGVFHPALLSPPKVIERGDAVTISALSPTISVKMPGTALSDGKIGQQISVKNKKSARIIRGTVIARGQVAVTM